MARVLFTLQILLLITVPVFPQKNSGKGEVYAIVVGISQYHYIKPLHYADSDAELFAELLQSGAGGNIRPENLFLLKNDSANAGNFWSAISRISNNKYLKEGDRVYIYFAGHGDAVRGLNEYYLLLSDCQPANDGNNYLLNFGAIDMYHLKNRIGLLASRGVEVILVLDACRTNELPGGYASQVFNSSIIQAKVGDIAMLATGPGQVSIEDISFGNGHGLFTYNLVDGWSGRADQEEKGNKDQVISLQEIKNWVSRQVQLVSGKFNVKQQPVFCCEEKDNITIGRFDSSFARAWNEYKQVTDKNNSALPFSKTQRGTVATADTSLLALFNQFSAARKENHLWGDQSADWYYDRMSIRFPGDPLTEDARYTLASDFINFVQQKINLYLEGRDRLSLGAVKADTGSARIPDFLSEEYERQNKAVNEKWTLAGEMLRKAGRLLSSRNDSSLLLQLKPKINFLLARGYVNGEKESELDINLALQTALEAYNADSSAAYTAECLGLIYAYRQSFNRMMGISTSDYEMGAMGRRRSDTAMRFFRKAIQLAPKWISPYRSIGLKIFGEFRFDSAVAYLHRALELGPDDGYSYMMLGDLYRQRNKDSALYFFRKALLLTAENSRSFIYRKMARMYMEQSYYRESPGFQPDSVLYYSRLALASEPGKSADILRQQEMLLDVYMNIARIYGIKNLPDSAMAWLHKAMGIAPGFEKTYLPYQSLIEIFKSRHQPDSARYYCYLLLGADSKNGYAMLELAGYYDNPKGNIDSAIYYYDRSLDTRTMKDLPRERLAYLLMEKDRNDTRPLDLFSQAMIEYPSGWRPYFNIACYYAYRGEQGKSLEYLEKALQRGMKVKKQIDSSVYLSSLRETESFRLLMAKYFPG